MAQDTKRISALIPEARPFPEESFLDEIMRSAPAPKSFLDEVYETPTAGERGQGALAGAVQGFAESPISTLLTVPRILGRKAVTTFSKLEESDLQPESQNALGRAETAVRGALPEVPEAVAREPAGVMSFLTRDVPAGVAQSGSLLLTAAAGGPLASALAGAATQGANAYKEAKAAGADPEQRWAAFFWNLPIGASDFLGPEVILGRYGKGLAASMARIDERLGGKLSLALATEGFTGGTQELFANAVAADVAKYDEERDIWANVPQSALLEGTVGAIFGGAAEIARKTPAGKSLSMLETVDAMARAPNEAEDLVAGPSDRPRSREEMTGEAPPTAKPAAQDLTGPKAPEVRAVASAALYEATEPQTWREAPPVDTGQIELDLDHVEEMLRRGNLKADDFNQTASGQILSMSARAAVKGAFAADARGTIDALRAALTAKEAANVPRGPTPTETATMPPAVAPAGEETAPPLPTPTSEPVYAGASDATATPPAERRAKERTQSTPESEAEYVTIAADQAEGNVLTAGSEARVGEGALRGRVKAFDASSGTVPSDEALRQSGYQAVRYAEGRVRVIDDVNVAPKPSDVFERAKRGEATIEEVAAEMRRLNETEGDLTEEDRAQLRAGVAPAGADLTAEEMGITPYEGPSPETVGEPLTPRQEREARLKQIDALERNLRQTIKDAGPEKAAAMRNPPAAQLEALAAERADIEQQQRRGHATDVELASGTALPAHYAVVEAESLTPSHDARAGFAKNERGDINERDYSDPTEGKPYRETVEKIANAPRPALLLSDTPTAVDGPPITTSGLVVLGGNARSMAVQLAYSRGGEAAEKIRTATKKSAAKFGIDPAAMEGLKNPVVVRVIPDEHAGKPGELSRILNAPLTTAKTQTTESVSRGSKVDLPAARAISQAIGDGTLAEALANPTSSAAVIRALVRSGAMSDADVTGLIDQRGLLTKSGKDTVEQTLLGAAVPSTRTLAEAQPATKNAILRALPAIVRVRSAWPEFSGILTNALDALTSLRQSGAGSIDEARRQTSIVPEAWKSDPDAVQLATAFKAMTPTALAGHLSEIADAVSDIESGQGALFTREKRTPAAAFREAFGEGTVGGGEEAAIQAPGKNAARAGEAVRAGAPANPAPRRPRSEQTTLGATRTQRGTFPGAGEPVRPGPGEIDVGGNVAGTLTRTREGSISAPEVLQSYEGVLRAVGSKAPIRQGRIRRRGAAGEFNVPQEVVRLQVANDLSAGAHEIAHAFEKPVFKMGGAGKAAPMVARKEILRIGRRMYPNAAGRLARAEGFAEFTRLWLTSPTEARADAPFFADWWEQSFLPSQPASVQGAVQRAREATETWRLQGSKGRGLESIVDTGSLAARTRRGLRALRRFLSMEQQVDTLAPLERLSKEVAATTGTPLDIEKDPFVVADALRGTHDTRVARMVSEGMLNVAGYPTGDPSLREGLRKIRGKKARQEFTLYLVAKRAKALLEHTRTVDGETFAMPRNPGLSLADANQIIGELETPEFSAAADAVYRWWDGVMDYAAEGSAHFAETVDRIRAADPGSYIPLQRVFDDVEDQYLRGKSQGVSSARSTLSAGLKGSGRQIKDPIPTLISKARSIVLQTHERMAVENVMAISKLEGFGHLVEGPLPKGDARITVSAQQALDELERLSGEDLTPLHQRLIDETVAFFMPKQVDTKSGDPIFPFAENGTVNWYKLDDRVYRAVKSLDRVKLHAAVDFFFGQFARVFRMGTTAYRARFALVTNPSRDPQTLAMTTQSTRPWPVVLMHNAYRLVRGLASAASGGKLSDPAIEAWRNMGGEISQYLGQDVPHTRRAARQLFQGPVERILDPRNIFDGISQLLSFPESAARATEIAEVGRQIGWKPGQPITFRQSLQLLPAGKRATVDFNAGGHFSRVMNQIIPFYNTAIQGPRAFARAARRNPARFAFRAAQVMALSLAQWWKNKDEPWYREKDAREKLAYWLIPFERNGRTELIKIPRPQEVSLIAGGIEAIADSFYRQDPKAAREFFGEALDSMSPAGSPRSPNLPPLLEEVGEQLRNKDSYTKAPVVPQYGEGSLQQEPEEQFSEYSSRAAIAIGQALGWSPKRIDHAVRGLGGGGLADVMDLAGIGPPEQKREDELADTTLFGGLFERGGPMGFHPRSVNELYEARDKAAKRHASTVNPETDDERAIRLELEDAAEAVTALSKARRLEELSDKKRELTLEQVRIAQEALDKARRGVYTKKPKPLSKKQRARRDTLREAAAARAAGTSR